MLEIIMPDRHVLTGSVVQLHALRLRNPILTAAICPSPDQRDRLHAYSFALE